MKLYDVIRKENTAHGKPMRDIEPEEKLPTRSISHIRTPFRWKKIIVIGGAFFFLVLLYVIGMKVARAHIVVNERRIPFTLNAVEFELMHEGDEGDGRLSFQAMLVPAEVSREVYGSQVDPSTSTAKGKVVFFNEYSTKPQTIKAKTTLTAANGKKYQTTQAVTVPGYTLAGKVKTPGTSGATAVIALAVGPSYNTTGTSFTVGGWAKTLYAQSAGSITGGEDGVMHSVSGDDEADVVATLQAQLLERLKRETRTQIPETLIAFPDMQVTSIDSASLQLRGENIKFPASIKGSMTTYLISRKGLEMAIAAQVLHDHSYPQVTIPSISTLTVTPITALPTDPNHMPDVIRVKISGEGTIITKAPLEVIKESLLGASKRVFNATLAKTSEVDTAEYHLYPFWAPFFPVRSDRITIEAK